MSENHTAHTLLIAYFWVAPKHPHMISTRTWNSRWRRPTAPPRSCGSQTNRATSRRLHPALFKLMPLMVAVSFLMLAGSHCFVGLCLDDIRRKTNHLPREREENIGRDKPSVRVSNSRLHWKGHLTKGANLIVVIFLFKILSPGLHGFRLPIDVPRCRVDETTKIIIKKKNCWRKATRRRQRWN